MGGKYTDSVSFSKVDRQCNIGIILLVVQTLFRPHAFLVKVVDVLSGYAECQCHCQVTPQFRMHLFFLLFTTIAIILLLSSPSLLSPHTTRTAPSEWRSKSKIDMLLGVETDNERGNVDNLFSHTIVTSLMTHLQPLGNVDIYTGYASA